MRVQLKTDPSQWVEIKERWSFGDKLTITEGGFVAMDCLITAQSQHPPKKLADFDDVDAEVVLQAIRATRQAQLGRLTDPSLLADLIAELSANEVRKEYAGLVTRARLCLDLRCLPDELDRQDDARIKEIILVMNAKDERNARDSAQAADLAAIQQGG